jgi:Putative DNA-binding domain
MNSQNDSTALAQQQRDLLHAIFTAKNIATQAINTPARGLINTKNSYSLRGLQTYQANAAASAQRSLQTAYPVIAQLIGDDAFAHLARDFWARHPPTCGDLAQWGADLSGFIARIPMLQTEPYLCDVAKAEWALHTAATAADQTADMSTFSLMAEQDPAALTLQLAPGTALVHSHYPIASILTAHVYDSPSFEEVGQKLRQNMPEIALVWRHGLRPMVAACTATEAVFIARLLAGASLLAALESDGLAASDPSFDFQGWLPQAVQKGLLLGVLPA